jgi:hypothetical protein
VDEPSSTASEAARERMCGARGDEREAIEEGRLSAARRKSEIGKGDFKPNHQRFGSGALVDQTFLI